MCHEHRRPHTCRTDGRRRRGAGAGRPCRGQHGPVTRQQHRRPRPGYGSGHRRCRGGAGRRGHGQSRLATAHRRHPEGRVSGCRRCRAGGGRRRCGWRGRARVPGSRLGGVGGCRRPGGPRGCGSSRRAGRGAGARTDRCSPDPSLSEAQHCKTSMGTTEVVPIEEDVRRRPTLPRSPPRSTIGAERLSFRVRDGTGRFPFAMVAETLWRCGRANDRTSGTAQWTRSICGQVLGLLVPVSFTSYLASTSGLSTRWSTGGLTP